MRASVICLPSNLIHAKSAVGQGDNSKFRRLLKRKMTTSKNHASSWPSLIQPASRVSGQRENVWLASSPSIITYIDFLSNFVRSIVRSAIAASPVKRVINMGQGLLYASIHVAITLLISMQELMNKTVTIILLNSSLTPRRRPWTVWIVISIPLQRYGGIHSICFSMLTNIQTRDDCVLKSASNYVLPYLWTVAGSRK